MTARLRKGTDRSPGLTDCIFHFQSRACQGVQRRQTMNSLSCWILCRMFVPFWYQIIQGWMQLFLLIKCVLLSLGICSLHYFQRILNCFSGARFSIPLRSSRVHTICHWGYRAGRKRANFKNRSENQLLWTNIYSEFFFFFTLQKAAFLSPGTF